MWKKACEISKLNYKSRLQCIDINADYCSKTICFVITSITRNYCLNDVFLFHSFLVLTKKKIKKILISNKHKWATLHSSLQQILVHLPIVKIWCFFLIKHHKNILQLCLWNPHHFLLFLPERECSRKMNWLFYKTSRILQLSEFVWTLRSSVIIRF